MPASPTPTRLLKTLAAGMMALMLAVPGVALAQTPDVPMREMPVMALYCEQDPGPFNPGGGRGVSLEELEERFGCRTAEGVAVTFRSESLDWFGRCDTEDDGICLLDAPSGPPPEFELEAAVHLSTVEPGYTPKDATGTTANYTEFAGYGVILLPDDARGTAAPDERRTLAVKAERDGDPVEVLTQLSEGDVTIDDFPWLATNEDGWVSYDLGSFESEMVDLMIDANGEPAISCSDIDHKTPLDVEWIEGREGDFARITLPSTDGDINCDVTLP